MSVTTPKVGLLINNQNISVTTPKAESLINKQNMSVITSKWGGWSITKIWSDWLNDQGVSVIPQIIVQEHIQLEISILNDKIEELLIQIPKK